MKKYFRIELSLNSLADDNSTVDIKQVITDSLVNLYYVRPQRFQVFEIHPVPACSIIRRPRDLRKESSEARDGFS